MGTYNLDINFINTRCFVYNFIMSINCINCNADLNLLFVYCKTKVTKFK